MMKKADVRQQILTTAAAFIQKRGYNAFSYRDIAAIVNVKTSSIHYYFPQKEDLGIALLQQHIELLELNLAELLSNEKLSYKKKFITFIDMIFNNTYHDSGKMCLGGMLASDAHTLPQVIVDEIKRFFSIIEKWLSMLLSQGIKANEFKLRLSVKQEANLIISAIEGVLLITRLDKQETRLNNIKQSLLASLN